MTLTKDKKTGRYKIKYKTPHGDRSISTKETSRVEAEKVAKESRIKELEQSARSGRITKNVINQILIGKKVTMETGMIDFKNWMRLSGRSENYIENTMSVLNTFVDPEKKRLSGSLLKSEIVSITEEMVYEFVNNPNSRAKASWRHGQLSVLNRFFEFCLARTWTVFNPAAMVRVRMDTLSHAQKEKKKRNPFTDKEVDRLLKDTEKGKFWHSAIAIARYTGLRLGDIAKMEWDSLSHPGKIIVWTDKRDKRVELPFKEPKLVDAVSAVPPINTRYMFPKERMLMEDPKRRANLSTYFHRICERSDIYGKTFHDLRSAYIVDCVKRGMTMPHIAKNVGHSSTTTTQGYIPEE